MRRTARENAFKLIFEKSVSGGTGKITCAVLTHMMTAEETEYFSVLVNGIDKNKKFLTDVIGRYSHGFDVDRIYKIDFAILLISVYEVLFSDDVPDKAAINEAVELAKIYSTDNSPSFINGIMASVVKNKEQLLKEWENAESDGKNSDAPDDSDADSERCAADEARGSDDSLLI